jgi:alkylation response protein AidB-like acyl-CoA dehydrogenase
MNFGFTEEQELLRATARDFLAEHAPMTHVRELMESSAGHSPAVWKRVAELGWTGLALPESYGGADLGLVEQCILLEEFGRSLTPVPFLTTGIAAAAILAAGSDVQKRDWLGRIASGDAIATLAITEEAGSEEPGDIALEATAAGPNWVLDGRKLFVPDAGSADVLVVLARTGCQGERGLGLFLVPTDAPGLAIAPMSSMDLLRPLSEVCFEDVDLPPEALLGENRDVWPLLDGVLDRARVMIAAEMVGGAAQCLDAAVAYAKERVQFGKPIGVNQAIKHKCADMLFEVESARSITYYAAWANQQGNDEAALTAAMAKAYVSDAYRHVAAENIQIHGGVGFTWEYDCHLFFKRAKSDEAWLGDATHHRERVATLLAL